MESLQTLIQCKAGQAPIAPTMYLEIPRGMVGQQKTARPARERS